MARSPLSALAFALATAAPLLGCEPPAGVSERAPEARQLARFREDGTVLHGFTAAGDALFLETVRGAGREPAETIKDVSVLDLTTGARVVAATGVVRYHEDGSFGLPPALVTLSEANPRGYQMNVTFPDGRPPVTVTGLSSVECCNDPLGIPWAVRRYDGESLMPAPWMGPFDALRPVDPQLKVTSAWTRDFGTGAFLVTATRDTMMPARFALWSLPFDGSAPSALLGPELGPVVPVQADEPVQDLVSHTLTDGTVDPLHCWSPGDWGTPLDFGIPGTRCYAIYQRTVGTKARLFLHDDGENTERLLPGIAPTNVASSSWNGRWVTWFAPSTGGDTSYTFYLYDLQTGAVKQCGTNGPGAVYWQSTGPGAVLVTGPTTASEIRVWDLSSPTCPVRAMAQQPQMVLSPDGTRWAWLETDLAVGSKVTLADRELSAPKVIAQGTYFQQILFLDRDRMLIWRTNLDGFGYSWIDTSLAEPVEHALAEGVFFISSRIDAHQIAVGHRYSNQDESGDLSIIDMDSGAERLISHAVRNATLRFEPSQDGGMTRLLDLAFVVRGRHASDQDGLWLAKLPFSLAP